MSGGSWPSSVVSAGQRVSLTARTRLRPKVGVVGNEQLNHGRVAVVPDRQMNGGKPSSLRPSTVKSAPAASSSSRMAGLSAFRAAPVEWRVTGPVAGLDVRAASKTRRHVFSRLRCAKNVCGQQRFSTRRLLCLYRSRGPL